jgi:hypothetical protein
MLVTAKLSSGEDRLTPLACLTGQQRGAESRILTAQDLVDFGRCPRRWVTTPDAEDPVAQAGPALTEWLAFAPEDAARLFVRRPDTYEAMILRCPKCNSRGPAKVCSKCGVSRRNVVEPRPWTSAAKQCADWNTRTEAQGLRVVTPRDWDLATLGAENILSDTAIAPLAKTADRLSTVAATWKDEETGLLIPLVTGLTLLPPEGDAMDNTLVCYTEARNADPSAWAATLLASGLTVRSALALQAANLATGTDRRYILWLVVEREEPRIVARRRLAAEVVAAGGDALAAVLAAYAQCVVNNSWPSFEPPEESRLEAWAETHLEQWMTAGTGEDGGYFAPAAAAAMVARKESQKSEVRSQNAG